MTNRAPLAPADARAFLLGGNAVATLESVRTGARYTYRVRAADDGGLHFVSVLTGADNEADYAYLGMIRDDRFTHGRRANIGADAPSVRAFEWAWPRIAAGRVPDGLTVWHEGRCGRCNRKLTVPESIASGLGPESSGRLARAKAA